MSVERRIAISADVSMTIRTSAFCIGTIDRHGVGFSHFRIGSVERYLELIRRTRCIHPVPVDRPVILRSVHLRADFGLRSTDTLHVATALVHGCETFVTNDRRLARVDAIRVLALDELGSG